MTMKTLHLTNSFWVYIIPAIVQPFNIIMVKTYVESIPRSLQEAAEIDGAGVLTVFFKVILPTSKPILATIAIWAAVGQWNSFMDTYLYAKKLPTLQYKLYEIMNQATMKMDVHAGTNVQTAVTPMSVRMAVTIVATVPIVIVYPFLQKYFIGGMTLGSVKD